MAAYREIHLNNGLQISAYQLPHLHSLEMGVYFKGGPLYENRSNQGISHLLEHLCYRNLNGIPQEQLYRQLDAVGSVLRGVTEQNAIIYRLGISPRFFDDAFDIMSRLFAKGKWTEEEIASEKQVVLRQIEEEEQNFLWDVAEKYWKTSAGAFPSMGTENSVLNMSSALIHQWKKKIFQPSNACFVLAGNFSDGMLKKAAEVLGELKNASTTSFEQPAPINFCSRDESSDQLFNADYNLAQVVIYFDIDANLVFPASAEILSYMTGESLGSALFMELREKRAMVDDISSEVVTVGSSRRFAIDYEVSHERLAESLELVFTILARLRRFISQEQVDRTRVCFTENEKMILDKASALSERLGYAWLGGNADECDVDVRMRLHEDLTAENIQDAAQAIFRQETLSCYIEKNPKKIKSSQLRDALKKCREMLV